MTGTTLVRTFAPMTAGACGAYDAGTDTTISGTLPIAQTGLPSGCYRYRLTGINSVGGSAPVTTTGSPRCNEIAALAPSDLYAEML